MEVRLKIYLIHLLNIKESGIAQYVVLKRMIQVGIVLQKKLLNI